MLPFGFTPRVIIVSFNFINPHFELTQDKLPQTLELQISLPSLIIRNNNKRPIEKSVYTSLWGVCVCLALIGDSSTQS